MDESKEYIKMCEGAREVQDLWVQKIGDISAEREYLHDTGVITDINPKVKRVYDQIWLPRQDQLHLLSKLSWQEFDYMCTNEYPLAITKEQAGIQVVMSQFNKEWKGNEWLDKTTQ